MAFMKHNSIFCTNNRSRFRPPVSRPGPPPLLRLPAEGRGDGQAAERGQEGGDVRDPQEVRLRGRREQSFPPQRHLRLPLPLQLVLHRARWSVRRRKGRRIIRGLSGTPRQQERAGRPGNAGHERGGFRERQRFDAGVARQARLRQRPLDHFPSPPLQRRRVPEVAGRLGNRVAWQRHLQGDGRFPGSQANPVGRCR